MAEDMKVVSFGILMGNFMMLMSRGLLNVQMAIKLGG